MIASALNIQCGQVKPLNSISTDHEIAHGVDNVGIPFLRSLQGQPAQIGFYSARRDQIGRKDSSFERGISSLGTLFIEKPERWRQQGMTNPKSRSGKYQRDSGVNLEVIPGVGTKRVWPEQYWNKIAIGDDLYLCSNDGSRPQIK